VKSVDPILVLENVHTAYLQKEILRGVSLTIHSGEIVLLVGENGSGKSTTLKVIAGLLTPSQGSVRFQDRDIKGLDISQRQRIGVGYLMQGGRVFPNLTVQENFNLTTEQAHTQGTPFALGDWFPVLRKRRQQRAGLLSGGQRQMLAIELVIAQTPNLLLLDEPTAALSQVVADEIMAVLSAYVERQSTACILVEQRIEAVSTISARSLQLIMGQIASK